MKTITTAALRLIPCLTWMVIAFLHAAPSPAQVFTGTGVQYNFESGPPIGWSPATVSASFLGGHALGLFGNQTASLGIMDAVSYQPGQNPSYSVILTFDLLLSGPWTGNSASSPCLFQVTENGNTLLDATFSTTSATQSYPLAYGIGSFPAGTGSFVFNAGVDSATSISATFGLTANPLKSTDIIIDFSANGLGPSASWQLDNVDVNWNPLPEPNALALFVIGMVALALIRITSTIRCWRLTLV